jgi:proliferating cell nuclear antigen
MQRLPREIVIIIMEKLLLKELIKLSSTCKLFNYIVKTTKWKKNVIFEKGKIFLQNESILNFKINLANNDHTIDSMESLVTPPKKNYILEICTSRTIVFKQIIKNISKVVSECSIVFISQDKESLPPIIGGIRVFHLTENNVLLNLNLNAQNFEHFKCIKPKITININMRSLYSAIKNINNDNFISMRIEDSCDILCIRETNENKCFIQEKNICVSLIKNFEFIRYIPLIRFYDKITMASDKLKYICDHLNNDSTFVEITLRNNEILFRGQNEGRMITTSYKDINKNEPNRIIQNVYESKNLMSFIKCTKLCNNIDFYMKNEFPLVLVINVGTLGNLYVFIPSTDYMD